MRKHNHPSVHNMSFNARGNMLICPAKLLPRSALIWWWKCLRLRKSAALRWIGNLRRGPGTNNRCSFTLFNQKMFREFYVGEMKVSHHWIHGENVVHSNPAPLMHHDWRQSDSETACSVHSCTEIIILSILKIISAHCFWTWINVFKEFHTNV